jgi:DNA-binding transcriptional ArsR family regulator
MQPILGFPQSFLSRHLAYLRGAGVVRDRRDGPRVFYSLTLDDEVGLVVQEFLQKAFPLFEIFRADSARSQTLTDGCSPEVPLKSYEEVNEAQHV